MGTDRAWRAGQRRGLPLTPVPPHMAPLTEFVRSLRALGHSVPDFDPKDGGINARVAFLSESPGPTAVASQFISRDNSDPSARNISRLLNESGLRREDVVLWNVVPYCVSTIERNRNATPRQIFEAWPYTKYFINILPRLECIVLCGRRAQTLSRRHLLVDSPSLRIFETYHSGAQSYNHQEKRGHMQKTYGMVAQFLNQKA